VREALDASAAAGEIADDWQTSKWGGSGLEPSPATLRDRVTTARLAIANGHGVEVGLRLALDNAAADLADQLEFMRFQLRHDNDTDVMRIAGQLAGYVDLVEKAAAEWRIEVRG